MGLFTCLGFIGRKLVKRFEANAGFSITRYKTLIIFLKKG